MFNEILPNIVEKEYHTKTNSSHRLGISKLSNIKININDQKLNKKT